MQRSVVSTTLARLESSSMSAKKSKKQQPRQVMDINEQHKKQSFFHRHGIDIGVIGGLAGVVSVGIAAIALVPSFRSTRLAEDANHIAQTAKLSIVGVDLTSTVELTENTNYSNGPVDKIETRQVNAAAAKIILRNQGEQTALIKELRVDISKVWTPNGCHGAGGATTSVIYDFILPGDIDKQVFPLQLPTQKADFEVAGQSSDRLAVTVGEEYMGEAGWPWAISASAELVLTDNSTLKTTDFTLMNFTGVDRVIEVVAEGLEFGLDRTECIQTNIGMLEEAIRSPGDHSTSIDLLLSRLKEIGFTKNSTPSTSTINLPGTTPVVPPGAGKWVAQLGSYSESAVTEEQMIEVVAKLEQKIDVKVRRIRSSDYSSLRSGYWFVFYDGDKFLNGHEALTFCSKHGILDENLCVGRYLSANESDKRLICKPSDPQDSPKCTRR
ncbi:hypothetical protein [Actinosynnema sp. NPDC023587]|uniref:hypothetical protein n=1 Tax=Actinosynnema sp. NPDC023587 TaxID=3154695 RepID=UPI003410E9FF